MKSCQPQGISSESAGELSGELGGELGTGVREEMSEKSSSMVDGILGGRWSSCQQRERALIIRIPAYRQ